MQPTRRDFLNHVTTGMMGVGLCRLMTQDARSSAAPPHVAPKARRVLQIFCPGAAAHMDLWEHKPMLEKMHGQPLPGEENFSSFQGKKRQPDAKSLAVCAGG